MEEEPDKPPLMTRDDVAQYLNLSHRMVDKLTAEGRIPRIKIGGCVRYEKADITEFIEANRSHSSEEEMLINVDNGQAKVRMTLAEARKIEQVRFMLDYLHTAGQSGGLQECASTLNTVLHEYANEHIVDGRVKPTQKQQLIEEGV